jgi:ComF family protein
VSENWRRSIVGALLPRQCLLCALPSGKTALCAGCRSELPALAGALCAICAHPLPPGVSETTHCASCLSHPPAFDATLACYRYADPVDQLIHSIKYQRRLTATEFFGRELVSLAIERALPRPDRLIPLPLSRQRLAERGFNQALELARPLARHFHQALDLYSLQRTRDTSPQVSLPWKARAQNIHQAFAAARRFDGEHVLVIDDVMTTGATLNEVARLLKTQGAAQVTTIVVARTLRHD